MNNIHYLTPEQLARIGANPLMENAVLVPQDPASISLEERAECHAALWRGDKTILRDIMALGVKRELAVQS